MEKLLEILTPSEIFELSRLIPGHPLLAEKVRNFAYQYERQLAATPPTQQEHPIKQIERLLMEKQDQEQGVIFNGKPCGNGCNCASVQFYHNGGEELKKGYPCLGEKQESSKLKTANTSEPATAPQGAEEILKLAIGEESFDNLLHSEKAQIYYAMTEYAAQERERAIQNCQDRITIMLAEKFGLKRDDQMYLLDSSEILEELEKLKGKF